MRLVAGTHGQAFFGLADQALISFGNLAIGMALIRLSSKEDYGLYIIGFGLLNLVTSINSALFTVPMTVMAHNQKTQADQRSYCMALLRSQVIFGATICLLIATAIYKSTDFSFSKSIDYPFAIALTIAIPGILLQDFFRRYHYLEFKAYRAFAVDALALTATLLILAFAAITDKGDMHVWAIIGTGLAGALSGSAALAWSGIHREPIHYGTRKAFLECWTQGRWALTGATINWTQGQSYAFFLSWLGGLAGLAEANAARLLLAPLGLLTTGLSSAMMPRLAKLRSEGRLQEMETQSLYFLFSMAFVTIGYSATAWTWRDTLTTAMLGEKYTNASLFILAWASVSLLTSVRISISILMQASVEFKRITFANFWSTLTVLSITGAYIHFYGILGSIYALAAGELIMTLFLWRAFEYAKTSRSMHHSKINQNSMN
ncbi:lipopolysaccharide biosynthesis protein [Thiorhodococcus fuscus]|uniref:Lipopolysaccharide biosynthesis protein n=1 Tax=Thiorhodococcus fuscus TaxID=527200 RepID=A0ABW4Y5L8_9GAMM